jgi:hypothetical protein
MHQKGGAGRGKGDAQIFTKLEHFFVTIFALSKRYKEGKF